MTPRCTLLAAVLPGALAGCTQIDTPIVTPLDLSPPPSAVLGTPGMAPPPVDPSFAGALTAYAASARAVPSARGAAAYTPIRQALRLLADAVALVPGRPEMREPAYKAANELRVAVALMATTYVTDPRAQVAEARRALETIAGLLREVATQDYAGSPEVLARTRSFEAAVRAVEPDDGDHREARLTAALAAAEQALESMLRAAIAAS